MINQGEKSARIERIKVENIAPSNFYKPVDERNNIFCRMKRNSSLLSKKNKHEQVAYLTERSQSSHEDMHEKEITFGSKDHSHFFENNLKRHQSFSLSLKKKSNKSLNLSSELPEISQANEVTLPSPKHSLLFNKRSNKSETEIEGTRIGVLSSKEILKKYEAKKIKEELDKKLFFDNYIKNMKMEDFDVESDDENVEKETKKGQRLLFAQFQNPKRYSLPENKFVDLSESQHKLNELLGNRLTDRDFIDFNVKLFEKRDINKKRYFERYHNILRKQRQEIS